VVLAEIPTLAVEETVGVVVADSEELVTTLEDIVGVVVAVIPILAVEDMVGVVDPAIPRE